MRLLKEDIPLEQPLPWGHAHTVAEGDITLPGGLREEARVLYAGAMVLVEHTEPLQDRLNVMGKVMFHALYTQGDPTAVSAMEATADFTCQMDLPGVTPRHTPSVMAQAAHVEGTAYNGRLTLRAEVDVTATATAMLPAEAVTGLTGLVGVQCRTRQVTVKRTVARGEGELLVREEFALPASLDVKETLYATAAAALDHITGGLGKAGLSGKVQLEVCHQGNTAGKKVVMTRHTLSFDHAVELQGEDGEALQGAVWVKDVAVASQDAGEGERTLRAEVLLGLKAWADVQESITVMDDAYTTCGDDLKMTHSDVTCRVEDHCADAAESGRAMLVLPDGAAPVRQVLCAFATPVMTGREQLGGRLTVEGMLETTILYMTSDSEAPVTAAVAEPFRLTFSARAGEEDCITLRVSDVEGSAITSDRVELRYIMHLQAKGVEVQHLRMVQDIVLQPAAAMEGSIVLYFAQPGETLWDIARRYRVPQEEIRTLNPDMGEDLQPGQGIVVWRR